MMSTKVKICGLKDVSTIRELAGLHVDEVGLVFAPSRRQVSPALAGELINAIRELRNADGRAPRTVGVFVNPSAGELQELIRVAPIDVIQLHGCESAELCREIKRTTGKEVWKALSVQDRSGSGQPQSAEDLVKPYLGSVDALLIDTAGGGTGQTFDWNRVPEFRHALSGTGIPLYVAGGLHPDNVRQLVTEYAPDGVDVSSGVETNGTKDIVKIRTFVERVN
ncbi:phosphoribosylanthranilate isomerase [Paenibacillus tarimensis]